MLESNTDRSYFMIGAVIVAAILIAGATYIFGDVVFGTDGAIKDTISSLFGDANTAIDGITVPVPGEAPAE